ncbi:MAG: HTH domain-containing protein [Pseudomonadota bacterium]
MKRADRPEELVDILTDERAHPAHVLADALGVSQRTVYRDVAHLIANGSPIAGESGVGYVLRAPVGHLPGVLSGLELEALSLGLAVMQSAGDPQLQVAAKRTLERLLRTRDVPKRIRERWGIGVYAGVPHDAETEARAEAKTQSRAGAEGAETPSGL